MLFSPFENCSYSGNDNAFLAKGPSHPDTARALFLITSSVGMVYFLSSNIEKPFKRQGLYLSSPGVSRVLGLLGSLHMCAT